MSKKLDKYNDDIIYYETKDNIEKVIKVPISFPKKDVKYLVYYKRNQTKKVSFLKN